MTVNWPKTLGLSEVDKIRIEAAHDQAFRAELISDPASILTSRGVEVPAGLTVKAVEDTADTYHLTIPPFVGSSSTTSLASKLSANPSWYCTTCTTTTPICIGSLASLTCIA